MKLFSIVFEIFDELRNGAGTGEQNVTETVGELEKQYLKTGILDEKDKENILSITHGDNFTKLIADMYKFLVNKYREDIEIREITDNEMNYLREAYAELKTYDKNVFPLKDLYAKDKMTHPLGIGNDLRLRKLIINKLKTIPSILLRNLRNDIKLPRGEYEMKALWETISSVLSYLKLVGQVSEDKRQIILNKIFSSENDTFEKVKDRLEKTTIPYLSEDTPKEDIISKIEDMGDEAEIIYDKGDVLAVIIKSAKAMQYIGCSSQWCFARNSSGYWDQYASDGFATIVFNFDMPADEPARMVVVLSTGDVYDMYNDFMEDGYEYLHDIGVGHALDQHQVVSEAIIRSTNSKYPQIDTTKIFETRRHGVKPHGLWYEINGEWVRWCESEMPGWVKKYNIFLDIDTTNILILDTYEKAAEFQERYEDKTSELKMLQFIDWIKVSHDYKGIEIPNISAINQGKLRMQSWVWSWDVNSGCIWDLSVIKGQHTVDCQNNDETDQDNEGMYQQLHEMLLEEYREAELAEGYKEVDKLAMLSDDIITFFSLRNSKMLYKIFYRGEYTTQNLCFSSDSQRYNLHDIVISNGWNTSKKYETQFTKYDENMRNFIENSEIKFAFTTQMRSMGGYTDAHKTIYINLSARTFLKPLEEMGLFKQEVASEKYKEMLKNAMAVGLKKTILHELQHAYDHFISGGKYRTDKKSKKYYTNLFKNNIPKNAISDEIYLSLPHEYWARFTETVADLNMNDDFNTVLNNFKQTFDGFNTLNIHGKKRILNSLYKYFVLKKEKVSELELNEAHNQEDKNNSQPNTYKVYHGTNQEFNKFDFNKSTQGIVWFTDNVESIKNGEHGGGGNKHIMTRYITINNPAGWDEYEKYGLQQLEDMGYDGVILPQGDKTDYFVFSNKSIRKINSHKMKLSEIYQSVMLEQINLGSNEIKQILNGYIEAALWTEEERLKEDLDNINQPGYDDNSDENNVGNWDDKETDLDRLVRLTNNFREKPIENFSKEDIEPNSLITVYQDIKRFLDMVGDSVEEAIEDQGYDRLGMDIWLSRNHHGAGFFDHSYDSENEKKLMDSAHSLGGVDLYINDNMKLSFSNEN